MMLPAASNCGVARRVLPSVVSLGVNLSQAAHRAWSAEKVALFRSVVAKAGVPLPTGTPLWIRRRRGAAHEVWFIFNVQDKAAST